MNVRALGVVLLSACGGSTPAVDAGTDAGSDAGSVLAFQPSNITLTAIGAAKPKAKVENIAGACSVGTDTTPGSQDCFSSPVVAVTQPDGSTVNLVVVQSLTLQANAVMRVTGTVPFVIVSLGDVTLSGTIDAHSQSLSYGAGGAVPSQSTALGSGPGGGLAGSGSAATAGGGASHCGVGGMGGGQTTAPAVYGSADVRPLAGGSAGGGGAESGGAGGGAVQIVAGGALTLKAGSYISVGAMGGAFGGAGPCCENAAGGGSGGAILLEATTVTVDGILAANGGGGGGTANAGGDATPDATAAPGGTNGGGKGGAGATVAGAKGANGSANGPFAAGGGGGVGQIRINTQGGTAAVTGTVSPAQSTTCATTGQVRALTAGP
jgi:hypothetical protein